MVGVGSGGSNHLLRIWLELSGNPVMVAMVAVMMVAMVVVMVVLHALPDGLS